MKVINTLIIIILLSNCNMLLGQNKLDLGVFLGYSEHGSDVHSWGRHGVMLTENSAFSYGLNLKYNASSILGLRANYWGSKISGQDESLTELEGHAIRSYSFQSPISELSLVAEIDPLGKKREGTFKRIISPYFFGGIGLSFTDPDTDFNNQSDPFILNDRNNTSTTNLQIPMGAGIKMDLNKQIFVSAEISSRLPINDYLEGISESANPDKNDSYQFIGLNIGFRFGVINDQDKDGIVDSDDECPEIFGLESFKGCPDTDEDGIADSVDKCPEVAGSKQHGGCLDSDGDGIPDPEDICPIEPGVIKYEGCPIPDSDQDGFNDEEDKCPNSVGLVLGCPDSDRDGIIDTVDKCPQLYGEIEGCPDSDGDGLIDISDNCPNEFGPKTNMGCPNSNIQNSANQVESFLINDIYFSSNSSKLDPKYLDKIDMILAFSKQYPNARFIITGHTDNRNSVEYNMNLSENRAKAVFQALINNGLNPANIMIAFVGETVPIGDNNSAEGQAVNRRVEVSAINK